MSKCFATERNKQSREFPKLGKWCHFLFSTCLLTWQMPINFSHSKRVRLASLLMHPRVTVGVYGLPRQSHLAMERNCLDREPARFRRVRWASCTTPVCSAGIWCGWESRSDTEWMRLSNMSHGALLLPGFQNRHSIYPPSTPASSFTWGFS